MDLDGKIDCDVVTNSSINTYIFVAEHESIPIRNYRRVVEDGTKLSAAGLLSPKRPGLVDHCGPLTLP